MARLQALQSLQNLFAAQTVATLPQIQAALGGVSEMTAFRVLREVAYRRSYNCNGRFYAAYDPARFDRLGLWNSGDIFFSADGSLKATALRMVLEAPSGLTHRELADLLKVRVHNTLLGLTRTNAVTREDVDGVFVYFSPDDLRHADQLDRRRQGVPVAPAASAPSGVPVSDAVVIAVLLTVLRAPGSSAEQVAQQLRSHSPPILPEQIQTVFARYHLDDIGEKGGTSLF